MKQLIFYAPTVTHTVETLVALWPGETTLIIDDTEAATSSEHPCALARLRAHSAVRIVSMSEEAKGGDILVALLRRDAPPLPAALLPWSKKSHNTFLLSELETRNPRYWIREWAHARHFLKHTNAVLSMAPRGKCQAWFFKKRRFYPNYVHPQFLSNDENGRLFLKLFTTTSPIEKDLLLNYLGSSQPESRHRALAEVQTLLQREKIPIIDPKSAQAGAAFRSYGGPEDRSAVPPLDPASYFHVLQRSHFTLCPNGWDNYSHRVVEAAICASIPILPAPAHRYAGLKAGMNCLEVSHNRWAESVLEAIHMPESRRASMQKNLTTLRENTLQPQAFSRLLWEETLGS